MCNKITHLIDSHHHADHAGASSLFDTNVTRIGHVAIWRRSDRQTMSAFEDVACRDAVKKTGRKRLIVGGLFRDWTCPLADKAREVIAWYFAEIPKVTTEAGVATWEGEVGTGIMM